VDEQDEDLTPEEMDAEMRRVAEAWHQKLAQPATKLLVEQGTLTVSPLVRNLLKLYPQKPTK
jgi:hypothetical protein